MAYQGNWCAKLAYPLRFSSPPELETPCSPPSPCHRDTRSPGTLMAIGCGVSPKSEFGERCVDRLSTSSCEKAIRLLTIFKNIDGQHPVYRGIAENSDVTRGSDHLFLTHMFVNPSSRSTVCYLFQHTRSPRCTGCLLPGRLTATRTGLSPVSRW